MEPNNTISRRGLLTTTAAATAVVAGTQLLTGCSSGSGNDSAHSSAGKPAKGGPKTVPNRDVLYPDGYAGPIASHKGPITTERATLRVAVVQSTDVGDWNKNQMTDWYEKRTNVHVKFEALPNSADRMTKVNAMLTSGDVPDIFIFDYGGFTLSQLQAYGSDQQLLIPLNKIIDEYCPETRRIFDVYPDAKKIYTMRNGEMYCMPSIGDCFACRVGYDEAFINKPWLDHLGLKVPESVDELETVLKAFKTKDPNRNGKSDEIPLTTLASDVELSRFIMSAFLYNPGAPYLVLNDGNIDIVVNKPGWREGLIYLNKLSREGLIPRTTFTQTSDQVRQLVNAKTPVVGAIVGNTMPITPSDPRYKDYVKIPTLRGPSGTRIQNWDYYNPYYIGHCSITSACKIPEIAATWVDGQYELEAFCRAYIGVLGTEWRWAKKGESGFTGDQAVYKFLTPFPAKPGRSWGQHSVIFASNDWELAQAIGPKSDDKGGLSFLKGLYDSARQDYYPYRQPKSHQVPPLALTSEESSQIADLETNIDQYVVQMEAKFVTGAVDPNNDGAWRGYVNTLNRMKLDTYLSIYQKAYNRAPK